MAQAKSRQKKFDTRIDFTPMVDMNMLLITFFMLCTTMIKSQTLSIALPTNEKDIEKKDMTQAKESEAITIIIDGDVDEKGRSDASKGRLYYYDGMPKEVSANVDENPMKQITFGSQDGAYEAVRKILRERNKDVVGQVEDLKKQWKEHKFSTNDDVNDSIFKVKRKEAQRDSTVKRPVVIIKATPNASYAHVVSILDEMQINDIIRYQIDKIGKADSDMMILVQGKNGK